jgi:hypothetical protein
VKSRSNQNIYEALFSSPLLFFFFFNRVLCQDGVRLGCYGYELEGKQYMTQYVADAKGYRLVTDEDLITVYPKAGGAEG